MPWNMSPKRSTSKKLKPIPPALSEEARIVKQRNYVSSGVSNAKT
jgi:hypothetical protein